MKDKEFIQGETIIKKEAELEKQKNDQYFSHEKEIKEICSNLIAENTEESLLKLIVFITENKVAAEVVNNTNWGRTLLLGCKTYYMEDDKKKTILSKVCNLEQLLFVMRQLRFLNYRHQVLNDIGAQEELVALMNHFQLQEKAREAILKASTLPEESYL